MFGLDKYSYTSDKTFMSYSFTSSGPNGSIQKIARFTRLRDSVYNFGFGDLNPETGDISDTTVSNNQDTDIIMGTLGSIVYDFTNIFPHSLIVIQGTSPARTRLYQININKHWRSITPVFDIYGLKHQLWEPLTSGTNYDAFLGRRRTS
jgi:hypothetical protein